MPSPFLKNSFFILSVSSAVEENLLSLLGPPELTLTPVLGGVIGVAIVAILGAMLVVVVVRLRSGCSRPLGLALGGGGGRPARPAQLPLKDKTAPPPARDELPPYSDKDDRNPDLIPCNKGKSRRRGPGGRSGA